MDLSNPIVWVHEEALGPANPALEDCPQAPALFVFDDDWIKAQSIGVGMMYIALKLCWACRVCADMNPAK